MKNAITYVKKCVFSKERPVYEEKYKRQIYGVKPHICLVVFYSKITLR